MAWQDELAALAGKTDQEAADAINAMTVPDALVPRWRIKQYLYAQGCYATMQAASTAPGTPSEVVGLIRTALAYWNDPDFENLDLGLLEVAGMFDQLNVAGLLSNSQLAAIAAMTGTKRKYPHVEPSEVWAVRNGRWQA